MKSICKSLEQVTRQAQRRTMKASRGSLSPACDGHPLREAERMCKRQIGLHALDPARRISEYWRSRSSMVPLRAWSSRMSWLSKWSSIRNDWQSQKPTMGTVHLRPSKCRCEWYSRSRGRQGLSRPWSRSHVPASCLRFCVKLALVDNVVRTRKSRCGASACCRMQLGFSDVSPRLVKRLHDLGSVSPFGENAVA
jgi:hypothetical protein